MTEAAADAPTTDGEERRAERGGDLAALGALVVLSALPYVARLGFYSDDWAFLSDMARSADRSLGGVFRALYHGNLLMRPGQTAELALLYRLFGLNPLPYHVVNAAVLLSAVWLFYLVLRELRLPRALALAVPAVYATLPHFSTDRFWVAAFQAPLSIALYLLSLHADLVSLRARRPRPWKALALAALVGSVLCYETAAPLFLLNAALVWWLGAPRGRVGSGATDTSNATGGARAARRARRLLWPAVTVATLGAVMVYKATRTSRIVHEEGWLWYFRSIAERAVDLHYYWLSDYGFNVRAALVVNFGYQGLLLPRAVWRAVTQRTDVVALVAAVAIVGLVYLYLRRRAPLAWRPRAALLVTLVGVALFFAGYAIFLTNYYVQFSPSGINNRTAIAAALGVAVTYVGVAALVASLAPRRLRHPLFCALVALLCGAGSVVVSALAGYWAEAWAQERSVLAGLTRAIGPTLPPRANVLLDGVCAYDGPGIVFESSWDLAGALAVHYRTDDLRADVVTPLMKVEDDSVRVRHYGFRNAYPYGPATLLYRHGENRVVPLTSAAVARAHFARANPDLSNGCPTFQTGHGVTVLY